MNNFNIQYGLSSDLFINGKVNPEIALELGCWYLCTDTAELFLCVEGTNEDGQSELTLKLINETTKDFITEAELSAYGFITAQHIVGKQDTITDLAEIRAGAALGKTALQTIPEEYITETELANKGYITNVSDKADINHKHEEYALVEHEHDQYLTEQDISEKADRSELFSKDYNELINKPVIPSIDGLATKAHVAEEIAKIEIPTVPDLTDYAKKSEIPSVADFIEAIPDEYVTDTELNNKGYLTAHQDISHLATKASIPTNISQLVNDSNYITSIPDEYITESELKAKGFITDTSDKADKEHTHSYNELTDTPEIPEAYNDTALRDLIAKKADAEHIHKEYAEAEHTHTQYITEQLLADYAKKSELPSHEGLATEEYVDNAIKAIPATDLTNYYNKTEVDGLISNIEHPAIPTKVSELENDVPYATEQFVADAIANQVPIDELAKKEEVLEVKTTIKEEVLPKVEKVDEIEPTVSELKTWVENKEYLQDIDLEGYATEEFVTQKIAEAELADQDVDLSAYYTKSETEATIKSAVDAIDVPDVSNLATKEELEAVQNVAGSNSVKLMQLDSDLVDINAKLETIPSIEGLATEEFVNTAINNIELPEAELYKVDFNAPDYAKAVEAYNNGKVLVLVNAAPDVNSYAVMNYVSEKYITFTKFLTSRSEAYGSFNTYYLHSDNTWEVSKEVRLNKVEANVEGEINGELTNIKIGKEVYSLPNTDGLASEQWVKDQQYLVAADIENKADKSELTTLATKQAVATIQTNVGAHETRLTSLETDFLKLDDELPDTIDKAITSKGYLTQPQVSSIVSGSINSFADAVLPEYATKAYVDDAVTNITVPEVDLTSYYTKQETDNKFDNYATKQSVSNLAITVGSHETRVTSLETDYLKLVDNDIPNAINSAIVGKGFVTQADINESINNFADAALSEFATETWVTQQNFAKKTDIRTDYLTDSDLADYAKKSELPSTEGLASEEFVKSEIAAIDIPETDLTDYYTKAETAETIAAAVAGKADDIPFTTDKFVGKAIGGFAVGEPVKGLTVAAILAKLLELTDGSSEEPEEPTGIIETIIAKEIPMYSINGMTVTEVPFAHYMYTEDEAKEDQNTSGFYQITDAEGNVIESGYQDIQIVNNDAYYLFALPKDVDFESMVTVKVYDSLANDWTNASSSELATLTSDRSYIESICSEEPQMYIDAVDSDKYTLYMIEETTNGKHYRFAIKEQ